LAGPETIDGMTNVSATRRPWTRIFAIYHGIGANTDHCSAHFVTEAGRGRPREVDKVLSAGSFRARNDLDFTDGPPRKVAARGRRGHSGAHLFKNAA
jgi:hypothetical protein